MQVSNYTSQASKLASKIANCGFTADYDSPRILVVVVSAATAVATTVQKFIVKGGRKGSKKLF